MKTKLLLFCTSCGARAEDSAMDVVEMGLAPNFNLVLG